MQITDFEKIEQIVNMYFNGTYQGDENLLRTAFHPKVRITGIIHDMVCDWSLDEFIEKVTISPTAENKGEIFDKEIITIDKTNHAGMVKCRVKVADLIFHDYITLLKISGEWVIRNKSFTA
jgi:hypothetical protein